ncbi:hypothetical protein IMSHALPRED_008409 [Imshaugia aleurites]|uniref:Uncharacterized protein n=1 Tax=Imshaugia aleurites TaxID=172621 RepID=A0A8H3EN71_9LECA|nr:hypothetical protein IMSHALPRED_008409 [Imshaugia aleurites]
MALPLSPTLTNPDMILPDNPPSSAHSSPSTPKKTQRLPSPSPTDYQHTTSDLVSDERPREKDAMFSPFKNGILRRHDGSTKRRSTAERDDGRTTPKEETALASSPTLQADYDYKAQNGHEVTAAQDSDHVETRNSVYSPPSILEEDEDDPHSHAAMTRRAEEILANAKKRLTVSAGDHGGSLDKVANASQNMEGNLSRARSTLERRPSSSMSTISKREAEPVSLYTLPKKGRSPGGFSPSKHRQAKLPMLDESQQGHTRVSSETSVPSALHTAPNAHSPEDKSVYAHGGDPAAKERNSEPSRNWFWNGLTRNTSLNHAARHNNGLQPLKEDGPAPESFEQSPKTNEYRDDETFDLETSPKAARFDISSPPTTELTRARSTTQMRDLRDQMQDLKGKISSLKQRAKEDNLRRRSIQSLRTPSPFTAAEEWYTGQPVTEAGQSPVQGLGLVEVPKDPDAERTINEAALEDFGQVSAVNRADDAIGNGDLDTEEPLRKPTSQEEEPTPRASQVESITYHRSPSQSPAERLIIIDDPSPVDLDGKDSLYGDQDYHESSAEPVVERHEDRPDAFDYEHFILHSAMGTYSGVGMRRSSSMRKKRDSDSSASSVETTKPKVSTNEVNGHATNGNESSSGGSHVRKDSVDSVSTINTFATATEGKHSPRSDDDDDWTPRQTMAGSWQPEPKKHKVNGTNGSPKSRSKKHTASAHKASKHDAKIPQEITMPTQPPDLLSYITSIARPDPPDEGGPVKPLQIGDRDRELIERLVGSLAKVCANLHALGTEGAIYEARVCRRKLDTARRMLDGEVNGEAF